MRHDRNPGMALLLLQEPHVCSRALPGTRSLHSADEVEEYPALPARRGTDHAPGRGILRLTPKTKMAPGTIFRCHAVCEIVCSDPSAAWAAARRAIGTRNGEHET